MYLAVRISAFCSSLFQGTRVLVKEIPEAYQEKQEQDEKEQELLFDTFEESFKNVKPDEIAKKNWMLQLEETAKGQLPRRQEGNR